MGQCEAKLLYGVRRRGGGIPTASHRFRPCASPKAVIRPDTGSSPHSIISSEEMARKKGMKRDKVKVKRYMECGDERSRVTALACATRTPEECDNFKLNFYRARTVVRKGMSYRRHVLEESGKSMDVCLFE